MRTPSIDHDSRPAAVGIVLATVAVLWAVLVPPPEALTAEMQAVVAVFLFGIVLWLTEAVPYVVSSTLVVTLLPVLGAVDSFEAATSGFSSTIVFFLLLVFLLGAAIAETDLDSWFASWLLAGQTESGRPVRSLATNLLGLSFVMPSAAARAVTLVPVVREMTDAFRLDHDSAFERSSFLLLGHVNPIASLALMTGGGMAIVTSGLVQSEIRPITWVEWAVLMIPPVVVLYALAAVTAERFYGAPPEHTLATREADGGRANLADGADSFTTEQRVVAAVLAGTVALWIAGSFVGLPTIVPAALAVAVLSLPWVGVLTAAEIADVSWGILFLVGAMFSLLDALQATGTLALFVDAVTRSVPFDALAHWQTVAVLLAIAVLVRVVFSTGSAAIVVVLPPLLQLADPLGVNQLYLALGTLLVVGSTTVFPFNTTSVLYSLERGPLSKRDVVTFGLVTMAYAFLVVAAAWLIYWPLVTAT